MLGTKTKYDFGDISLADMSEFIYFLKDKTDDHLQFNLYSIKPDGSQLTLRYANLNGEYVVRNGWKTLFILSYSKNALFSVDLTKAPGKSEAKEVLKLQNHDEEYLVSFSVSSDGSRVIFTTSPRDLGLLLFQCMCIPNLTKIEIKDMNYFFYLYFVFLACVCFINVLRN